MAARSLRSHRWILAAILLFAFVLRAWNLDWDRGTHLQPDERFWSDVAANITVPDDLSDLLDPEISSLNPRVHKPNYVYGTLPLWASESAAAVLMTDRAAPLVSGLDSVGIDLLNDEAFEGQPLNERLRFNTGFDVTIVGRLMSALIDTMTVLAVYLLAKELTDDRRVGLLGAFLQACTVLHIQYSHFLGSEPWVAFFVAMGVWGSVRLARGRGGWRTRIGTAVAVGFAIASKLNGIAVVAAPAVALLIALGPDAGLLVRRRIPPGVMARSARKVEPYLVMGIVAVVAYRIAQPYDFKAGASLIFNERFTQDVEYLTDINQGGNWPWVQPLVGRTPLVHPLKQMFLWGMGPALGLAAIFGMGRAVRRFFGGERYWAVPLAVIAAYWVLVSLQFYAIVRYLQPSYPVVTALSAAGLVAAWRAASAMLPERAKMAWAIKIAVAVVVGVSAFWALAFVNGVYNNTNARLTAGEWMVDNLPEDAVVSQQAWDDGLPWGQASTFGRVTLEPFSFSGDSPERIELLIQGLNEVDYVIESSNKFYDSLPRTPARFPQITQYYDTLFDGSLGFELIETFQNQPSLFGITIDDAGAEEAFTLYDHPTVFIWRKTESFSVDRAFALLNPDRARTAINAFPGEAGTNANMLPPAEYATQQQGSSFADVHSFDPSGPVAAGLWFVLIQLMSLAVAPTLMRAAGSVAGAAYGLTKPLALIVLALPIWLLVSWGVFDMSKLLVVTMLVLMLGLGVWRAMSNRARLAEIWREHRRMIIAAELMFTTVFIAVLLLRAGNPDVWHPWRGGEKPMELAYLTAVTGSTTLPPYDPWLAGGSLNYYYMGWFLLAVPIRILGFTPDVGFNLGVVTYAALAAVTVFSTAAMLAQLAQRRSRSVLSPGRTGVLATVLFLIIGNLDGFRQLITRLRTDLPLSDFDWWDPSRVNKNSAGFEVTEFPSFTVLFADLHPHFMAMPIFGLGLAGAVGFVEQARKGRTWSTWWLAAGLGVGSGLIRMVHTWDLPAFLLIVVGAIIFGWVLARGPAAWRAKYAGAQLVLAGAAHLAVTAPYRARNRVSDSGFSRSESVTNLDDWLVHWGLFLFVGAAYLGFELWSRKDAILDRAPLWLLTVSFLAPVGFLGLHSLVGSVAAWAFLGLVAAATLLTLELVDDSRSTPHVMVAAMWLLGFAILVGVEAFTQNADIARLNTVFKFWLQVWHLFTLGTAFGAAWLLGPLFERARVSQPDKKRGPLEIARRPIAAGLVLLLLAALVYPVLSVQPRQANRFDTSLGPSLQGDLWLNPGQSTVGIRDVDENDYVIDPGADRAIIEWLQENVEGRPTIVEAVGGAEYQWWGRVSIQTGLPTVLGWRWHQTQQRPIFEGNRGRQSEVDERKFEVAAFYRSQTDREIEAFLRQFDVSYIIVGSLETAVGERDGLSYSVSDPLTLQLFAGHPSLTAVFTDGNRAIYEVDKDHLARRPYGVTTIGAG